MLKKRNRFCIQKSLCIENLLVIREPISISETELKFSCLYKNVIFILLQLDQAVRTASSCTIKGSDDDDDDVFNQL